MNKKRESLRCGCGWMECVEAGGRFLAGMMALGLLVFAGCTTVHSLEEFRTQGGNVELYDVPYPTAFELGRFACEYIALDIELEDLDKGVIVAGSGFSGVCVGPGERVGLYFERVGANQTKVRVISKAKVPGNVLATPWESEIHSVMHRKLQQSMTEGKLNS